MNTLSRLAALVVVVMIAISATDRPESLADGLSSQRSGVASPAVGTMNTGTAANLPQSSPSCPHVAQYDAAIPTEWQATYSALNGFLDNFDKALPSRVSKYHTTYGAELDPANGDNGTKIFSAENRANITKRLKAYKSIGIAGVTIKIPYPILLPSYPDSSSYLKFYEDVVQEARGMGMYVDIQNGILQTSDAGRLSLFKNLTLDTFASSKRQIIQLEIDHLSPDVIDMAAEPDTHAWMTGLPQLNTPSGWWDSISGMLDGLNKKGTKIAVGGADWDSPDFITQALNDPRVDYIAVHSYPLYGDSIANLMREGQLAKQHGKPIIMGDFWDLKSASPDPNAFGGLPSGLSAINLAADRYGFWIPLDLKFLGEIAKFSNDYDMAYVSPYWSDYFFAYLNYGQTGVVVEPSGVGYGKLAAVEDRVTNDNITNGIISPLGCFYKRLATGSAGEP